MEIDHGFTSEAVIGRVTTHPWGRPALRAFHVNIVDCMVIHYLNGN